MIYFISIFILSLSGAAIAIYLIRQRKIHEMPVCILGDECHKVLKSKYNKLLGINNDILGLLFYILVSALSIYILVPILINSPFFILRPLYILILGAVLFSGALLSVVLLFIQWRLIKSWCLWCVLSSIINILMVIIFLFVINIFRYWIG